MVMTSRERVIRALNHQEADRIPIDFGGAVITSLDYHAHRNLKRHLNLPEGEDQIIDYSMGTVEPCDVLKLKFASDFRRILRCGPASFGRRQNNRFGRHVDA